MPPKPNKNCYYNPSLTHHLTADFFFFNIDANFTFKSQFCDIELYLKSTFTLSQYFLILYTKRSVNPTFQITNTLK